MMVLSWQRSLKPSEWDVEVACESGTKMNLQVKKKSLNVFLSSRSLKKPNLSAQTENGHDFLRVLELSLLRHLKSGTRKTKKIILSTGFYLIVL